MGAKKSAKYLLFGGMFSKVISFIGSIALARLLFPEDYAYLLSAMIITGFIQMFGNVGFENFYLQEKIKSDEEEQNILNVTYKLRLITNGILFTLQIIVSYIIEWEYHNDVLAEMVRIFSFTIPLTALSQVNLYILRKKLNYKPEVYANLSRDIIATITKVSLALLGFGALSFAFGALLGNVVRTVMILSYQSFKVDWKMWNNKIFKKVFFFGKHSFFAGIGMFFTQQIDKIFLSSYYSPSKTGAYYFANSQAQSIFSYIIAPQASLIVSYGAKYKDDTTHLLNVLSRIAYLLGTVLIPISLYVVAYADPIFHYIFGEKWNKSIYLFQIFTIYFLLTELTFPLSGLMSSFGRPELASKLVYARLSVLSVILLAVVLMNGNINIYLYSFVTVSFVFSWIKAYFGLRLMNKHIYYYLGDIKELMPMSLVYILLILLSNLISDNTPMQMLISMLLFVIVSIIMHLFIFRKKFIQVFKTLFGNHWIVERLEKI